MPIPSTVDYFGNAVLRHDSNRNDSITYFINRGLSDKNVDAQTIRKVINEYRLVFCNHYVETSGLVKLQS